MAVHGILSRLEYAMKTRSPLSPEWFKRPTTGKALKKGDAHYIGTTFDHDLDTYVVDSLGWGITFDDTDSSANPSITKRKVFELAPEDGANIVVLYDDVNLCAAVGNTVVMPMIIRSIRQLLNDVV